jgi:hypothetical protein
MSLRTAPNSRTFVVEALDPRVLLSTGPQINIADDSGASGDRFVQNADTILGRSNSPQTFILASSGDQPLHISSFLKTGSNAGDFQVVVKDNNGTAVNGSSFAIAPAVLPVRDVCPGGQRHAHANVTFTTDDINPFNDSISLNMQGLVVSGLTDD